MPRATSPVIVTTRPIPSTAKIIVSTPSDDDDPADPQPDPAVSHPPLPSVKGIEASPADSLTRPELTHAQRNLPPSFALSRSVSRARTLGSALTGRRMATCTRCSRSHQPSGRRPVSRSCGILGRTPVGEGIIELGLPQPVTDLPIGSPSQGARCSSARCLLSPRSSAMSTRRRSLRRVISPIVRSRKSGTAEAIRRRSGSRSRRSRHGSTEACPLGGSGRARPRAHRQ
jgi:hypothetical protein